MIIQKKPNDNIQKNSDGNNVNSVSAITLTDFLQKSVIVPMQAHVEILNNETPRIHPYDLGILGHFKSLRNYCLLMDAEFGSLHVMDLSVDWKMVLSPLSC